MPLIYWSIKAALKSKKISKVFVSSNDEKILKLSVKYGAEIICRPHNLCTDLSSSESGWLHASKLIDKRLNFKNIVVLQATSPYRKPKDLDLAIKKFEMTKADSLFSAHETFDTNLWEKKGSKFLANYDYLNRKPRQKNNPKYLENGSFYIFKKNLFYKHKNRLFGKIEYYKQDKKSSMQIDDKEDFEIISKFFKN